MDLKSAEQNKNKFYNMDEYIADIDNFIKKLENAIEKDSEEKKRIMVLISPLFTEYRKTHGYSEDTLNANNNAYSYFLQKSSELLKLLNEYKKHLKKDKDIAEKIAERTKKPRIKF